MSADLLEAFGTYTASNSMPDGSEHVNSSEILKSTAGGPQVRNIAQTPLWKKDTSGTDVLFDAGDDADDGDDFGDFEGPEPTLQQSQRSQPASTHASSTVLLDLEDLSITDERIAIESQAQVIDTNNDGLFGSIVEFGRGVTTKKAQQEQSEFQDTEPEDEWGTFEDVEPVSADTETTTPAPSKASRQSQPSKEAIEEDDWAIFDDKPVISQSHVTPPAVLQQSRNPQEDTDDDDWDAFEDGPATEPPMTIESLEVTTRTSIAQPVSTSTAAPTPSELRERPTNVPPPSLLLELLPTIYQNLATQSRGASSSSHGGNIATAAHHILRIFLTTARILSGRAHRWKRDPHLSQSVRVSAAGAKGMKLKTLDRSHNVKEDQDALEATIAWSRYAHAFNSTLLKARLPKPTATTNLASNMPVRAANGPGVLTAKEVCAVCGLKRNERVVGVDTSVEDVFGEFWVEFWGHKDCYAFWEEAEGMLERR